MAKKSASFLGANTPKGFVSLFDELYNPYDNTDAYIIKGGPGTGKSTLMKSVYAHFKNTIPHSEAISICLQTLSTSRSISVGWKKFAPVV